MTRGVPLAFPGQRIGLFGGSFDPAHEGHAHVAETALKRLGLDRVWWLVTPQNPLKPQSSSLEARIASAERMAHGRKMIVTAFEAARGYRYTYQTLAALKRLYPQTHFVLIVGADNLAGLTRWRRWRQIMRAAPMAIVARPGAGPRAREAKAATVFEGARRPANGALASARPPAWAFLNARFHPQSSTALRAALAKPGQR
ncbi:MAG: nicotinate-nucleotide adenylyltransferase [Hyphomonadaceae bacterium]